MNLSKFHKDFLVIKENNKGKIIFYVNHEEANEYMGCEYIFDDSKYIQRTAKRTPKKVGYFVTLWKRGVNGETTPYDSDDDVDFILIICVNEERVGRFLFPKNILLEKKILSSSKNGKRGFRVYPIWDFPMSAQALQSQKWQLEYFSTHLKLF